MGIVDSSRYRPDRSVVQEPDVVRQEVTILGDRGVLRKLGQLQGEGRLHLFQPGNEGGSDRASREAAEENTT
jgi:hypothetical protein